MANIDSIVNATKVNNLLKADIKHGFTQKKNKRAVIDTVFLIDSKTNLLDKIIFSKLREDFDSYTFYYNSSGKLIYSTYEKIETKTKTEIIDVKYYYSGKKIISMAGANSSKANGRKILHVSNNLRQYFKQKQNK